MHTQTENEKAVYVGRIENDFRPLVAVVGYAHAVCVFGGIIHKGNHFAAVGFEIGRGDF